MEQAGRRREAGWTEGKWGRVREAHPKLDPLSKHELPDLLSPSKNNPKTIKTSVPWARLILRISHRGNIDGGVSTGRESRTFTVVSSFSPLLCFLLLLTEESFGRITPISRVFGWQRCDSAFTTNTNTALNTRLSGGCKAQLSPCASDISPHHAFTLVNTSEGTFDRPARFITFNLNGKPLIVNYTADVKSLEPIHTIP